MSKEAMKLALEALEQCASHNCELERKAITALREALAQPDFWEGYVPEPDKRQQALDKKAENARELGLDYEPVCNKDPQGCWNVRCQLGKKCKNTPAQQEPVARQYQGRDGVWKDFISEKHYKDTLEDGSWPIRNLYTSPPAQRTWVGLTDEEITDIWAESSPYYHEDDFARAIEAKLRSKNEDRN